MTIIIASHEGILADTGVYFGNFRAGPHLKVVRSTFRELGPGWFAGSGDLSACAKMMLDAVKRGVDAAATEVHAGAVFLSDKGVLMENDDGAGWYEISLITPYTFLGAGKSGAMALLGSGLSPLEAMVALHKTFVFMDFPLQQVYRGEQTSWLYEQGKDGLTKRRWTQEPKP